jgi:hypothetical protein
MSYDNINHINPKRLNVYFKRCFEINHKNGVSSITKSIIAAICCPCAAHTIGYSGHGWINVSEALQNQAKTKRPKKMSTSLLSSNSFLPKISNNKLRPESNNENEKFM